MQEFTKRADVNIGEIRDKIINVLGDNSLYGTITDTVNAIVEEANKHESIQALMNDHKKDQ